ncbi:MAG: DUF2079 domain-containing protein [Chloroflexota bacterium]
MVAAYVGYFSVLSIRERAALFQFDEDLAIYDQIVWNTAHGRFFASTLIQHANNMLGDHFSPAVAIFAPIYRVWPNAEVLLIGQTLLLGLMAVPLFLFARDRLGAIAGLAVAGAYLVYPALHYVNLFQFHEIAMLPFPLALALLAVEHGSRRLFFTAALVSLTVKEEVAIVVVGVGLLWWLRRRDWTTGLATITLGVIVGAITIGIILPHFSLAGHEYYYVRRYAYLGNGPLQMALTALTSPGLILAHLTTPDRLLFLGELFLPLLLLPILGWEYVVAALPVFGYLLLAESPDQYAIDRHYLSPLLPFLFFGCVLGVERVAAIGTKRLNSLPYGPTDRPITRDTSRGSATASREKRPPAPGRAIAVAACVLAASALASYLIGPTPFGRKYDGVAFTATEHTEQVRRLIDEVPPNAPVSASRNLLSWFSERPRVYRFPEVGAAEYVLLDYRDVRYPAAFSQDDDALGHLLDSPDYRLTDTAGATLLFQRGDPAAWNGPTKSLTRFGQVIDLLDARLGASSASQSVEVTLYWRALAHSTAQYTVFVHVLSPDGKVIGQADSWPLDNLYPTDMWRPGQVIPDRHTVHLNPVVPISELRAEVGLYDLKTGARLPITARGLPGGSDDVVVSSSR